MPETAYRERKRTTPASRIKAARHAIRVMRTWEFPAHLPDGADWWPTAEQITARTRAMYRITPSPEEIRQALDAAREG